MTITYDPINTNGTCSSPLVWNQTSIDNRRPLLYVCIIATITHSVFWLQLVLCPSVRQKTMQWLYAYLITDILLLFRFFFSFIMHTTLRECTINRMWYLCVCYFEAFFDNYLNMLEVYILLALNLCRYAQISRNKNVYVTNVKLLIFIHLAIYITPMISFIIQLLVGWAKLVQYVGESCDIRYTNIYAQTVNTFIAYALPIILNILVIYASVRYIHLKSRLRPAQHQASAREKYHRSLVMQFFIFYTVWLLLWAPNVIVYQFTSGANTITLIASLLNYIEIALDPLIIGALDVRFYRAWKDVWRKLKNRNLRQFQQEQRRIGPTTIGTTMQTIQQKRTTAL